MTDALYERREMLDITGGTLRPGGTELTRRALEICRFKKGETILDLGCGPGATSSLMREEFGLVPLALDYSAAMLKQAGETTRGLKKVQASGTSLPFRTQSLKGTISECVLSLTEDIDTTLSEISRVTEHGGKLILSDIYSRNATPPETKLEVTCCFNGAKALGEIEKSVTSNGFKIILMEDHTQRLKQLAGQIIFSMGSLEKFWALFMGNDKAAGACSAVKKMMPGYYLIIAEKE
jgi:ubiquinone/menaquinone biosynthesis C-methylase UbiE